MESLSGVKAGVGALVLTLTACMPGARSERGLQRELAQARYQAETEHARVQQLEERLARVEQAQATQRAPIDPAERKQSRVSAQLEQLILMNQNLLLEVQAQRVQETLVTPTPVMSSAPGVRPSGNVPPECNTGLSTEQKILELVLELRGQRSPWRVDGLSYEESQALRFLLRRERELDARNPWQ